MVLSRFSQAQKKTPPGGILDEVVTPVCPTAIGQNGFHFERVLYVYPPPKIFVVAEVLPAERYRSFRCQDALGGGTGDRVDIVEADEPDDERDDGEAQNPDSFQRRRS